MKDLLLFYSANYQLLKNFITKNNLFIRFYPKKYLTFVPSIIKILSKDEKNSFISFGCVRIQLR